MPDIGGRSAGTSVAKQHGNTFFAIKLKAGDFNKGLVAAQ
jgi:hypothetical protein